MESLTGLFYFLGAWLSYFIMAFVLTGIAYLAGWRKYPKWKARFWWITFGFAGIISLMVSFTSEETLTRGTQIIGFFIFIIVALIIWRIKRGLLFPPHEPPQKEKGSNLRHTQKSSTHISWIPLILFLGAFSLVIIFALLHRYTPTSSPPSSSQPPETGLTAESQTKHDSSEDTINPPAGPLENMEKEKSPPGDTISQFSDFMKQKTPIASAPPSSPSNSESGSTKALGTGLSAKEWYEKGQSLWSSGNYSEAIDAYKKVIEINPDFAEAHYDLGVTFELIGRDNEAIEAYKQAIHVKPKFSEAHYKLGVIYLKTGEKSMAFDQHKILKDLDPNKAKQLFDLYWNK